MREGLFNVDPSFRFGEKKWDMVEDELKCVRLAWNDNLQKKEVNFFSGFDRFNRWRLFDVRNYGHQKNAHFEYVSGNDWSSVWWSERDSQSGTKWH